MLPSELWRRILMFAGVRRFRADMDEELRSHLSMKEAELRDAGMAEKEAESRARVKLGNAMLLREKSEDVWGWTTAEALFQDLNCALRVLRKSPTFTVTAILILALAIGANTAIFSLINAVMLRSMPVREPEKLVEVARYWTGHQRSTLSYPLYKFFRDESHSFAGMLAQSSPTKREIEISGSPETVETQMVSGSYYETLGVRAEAGRMFTSDYDRVPGVTPLAVISHRYWQRRFELNPAVIGKTFKLEQTVFTIVGVTPKEFYGTMPGHDPDVTLPVSMDRQVNRQFNRGKSWLSDRQTNWLWVMGRLKTDVSLRRAEAETRVLFQERNQADADGMEDSQYKTFLLAQELFLEPARAGQDSLRVMFSEPLQLLMCIVGLVLLLACVNLSSLFVSRTFGRLREISVRVALGAGRGRLIRQFLVESSALTFAGGLMGIVLAQVFCRLLVILMSNGKELFLPVEPDARVLAFTGILSLGTSLAVGLAPAVYGTRLNISPGLKEARTRRRNGLAKALIVAQVAISLVLLVGAGLFLRTLINLRTLDAGFRPDGVLAFSIDSNKAGYKGERLRNLQATVLDRIGNLTGVNAASLSTVLVLTGTGWNGTVDVEDYTYHRDEDNHANFNEVAPKFFQTMDTPVLLGREFDGRDTPSSQKVVIVNEAFARYYFGDKPPLGKHVKHSANALIVGVVKDVKYQNLRETFPRTVYFPALQDSAPQPWATYLVRVNAGEPLSFVSGVRGVVHGIDPALHIGETTTLADLVDQSILKERMLAMLSSSFGLIALMLACLGIFGVMASYVARRSNEFGIRLALGAQRGDLLKIVLFDVAVMLGAGILLGLPAAGSVTGVARGLLFELKPNDPITFGGAAILVGLAAMIAGYLPARRAARVDPIEALRAE